MNESREKLRLSQRICVLKRWTTFGGAVERKIKISRINGNLSRRRQRDNEKNMQQALIPMLPLTLTHFSFQNSLRFSTRIFYERCEISMHTQTSARCLSSLPHCTLPVKRFNLRLLFDTRFCAIRLTVARRLER